MIKNKILFVCIILLLGCEKKNNSYYFNNQEYKECSVLLDLNWGESYTYEHTRKALKLLIKSDRNYKENFQDYSFDSLIEHRGDFIFSFTNKCEKKENILKQYIKKYLVEIDGFPVYEIKPILK